MSNDVYQSGDKGYSLEAQMIGALQVKRIGTVSSLEVGTVARGDKYTRTLQLKANSHKRG